MMLVQTWHSKQLGRAPIDPLSFRNIVYYCPVQDYFLVFLIFPKTCFHPISAFMALLGLLDHKDAFSLPSHYLELISISTFQHLFFSLVA